MKVITELRLLRGVITRIDVNPPPVFLPDEGGEDGGLVVPGPPGQVGPAGEQGPPGVPIWIEGEEGPEGMPVPGRVGADGLQGAPGVPIWIEGEEGPEGMPVPGRIGADGLQGAPGVAIFMDGDPGEEGPPVPGPVGPTGADGLQGPPGVAIFMDGDPGEEGSPRPGRDGTNGLQGPPGVPIFMDGDPGEEGSPRPGRDGTNGAQGAPGVPIFMDGDPGEEGLPVPGRVGVDGLQGPPGVPIWIEGEEGEPGPPIPGSVVAGGGGAAVNYAANGDFWLFQRLTPGTLTTVSGDAYGPDRWRSSRENADLQWIRGDNTGGPAAGLTSRWYGSLKKITNAGKWLISQWLEGAETTPLQGRTLTLQVKFSSAAGLTLRIGLLALSGAGTIDVLPAAIVPTTWGASGTDPTLGANLSYLTPAGVPTGASGTISGNGITCTGTAGWTTYGGTYVVPANVWNLGLAFWSNAQFPALTQIFVGDVSLMDGPQLLPFAAENRAAALQRCQRWFQKTYDVDTVPGTAVAAGHISNGTTGTVNQSAGMWQFKATMRADPTVTLYSRTTGAAGKIADDGSGTDQTGNVGQTGQSSCLAFASVANSSNDVLRYHATAEAEL